LVGLFTRPVAFVLSGLMALAYFMAHAPQGFWPILNRGELAVLYCFVFLYMSAAGGGPWSIDRWLLHRKGADKDLEREELGPETT
jgi:putative oxidoreductase